MSRPSTIKINVTLIQKEYLYQGKTAKYLDCSFWENRDGPDQYGNTHTIVQDVGKEAREKGVKGKIIGSLKWVDGQPAPAKPAPPPNRNATRPAVAPDPYLEPEDDIPF